MRLSATSRHPNWKRNLPHVVNVRSSDPPRLPHRKKKLSVRHERAIMVFLLGSTPKNKTPQDEKVRPSASVQLAIRKKPSAWRECVIIDLPNGERNLHHSTNVRSSASPPDRPLKKETFRKLRTCDYRHPLAPQGENKTSITE